MPLALGLDHEISAQVDSLVDLLLGSVPVFWIHHPVYIIVAAGAALGTLATLRAIPLRRNVPRVVAVWVSMFGALFLRLGAIR